MKMIQGFENLYWITEDGEVFSAKRKQLKKLSPQKNTKGYLQVVLYDVNKVKHIKRVHRLVAEAFIPNRDGLPQVNHLNRNKEDNTIGNLEWVTNQENCEHALSKSFTFVKDGEKVEVFNLTKWCRENNFDLATFYKLMAGDRKSAYGYRRGE